MQPQERSLETIIHEVRSGKDRENNCHLLFSRFYRPVCNYFQSKGISADDSQDLAQDVFCLVFRRLDSIKSDTHFIGWLFTIARNVFNNEIERRHTKKRLASTVHDSLDVSRENTDVVDSRSPAPSAIKRVLDKEKVRALLDELHKLPDQMRRCVYLRVAADRSDEEIAVLLGISCSTVRVQLHRARKSLSETLRPIFGDLQI